MADEMLSANFKRSEFECPDCGADDISMDLVAMLQKVRTMLARPVVITSGVRCEKHNAEVGGIPYSAHLTGLAADISVWESEERLELIGALVIAGFTRIGLCADSDYVHVDIDDDKPGGLWVEG